MVGAELLENAEMAHALSEDAPPASHEPGADAHHGHAGDPGAAPMHGEIKESFSAAQVAFVASLGLIATVAGIVAGIVLAND